MAAAPVGAGDGLTITTGTDTVLKTGCTAGNVILIHIMCAGATEDWSDSNIVNLENVAGVEGALSLFVSNRGIGTAPSRRHALFMGRAVANGTCSADFTVGGSGDDLFIRMYEFSEVYAGATIETIMENDDSFVQGDFGTGTGVGDCYVLTSGDDRLACNFVALADDLAIGSFTGETGGDWTEAFAEYVSATGATGTLQLQTASMPSAGTIDGGSFTVGASVDWGALGLALIPAAVEGVTFKRLTGPAQLSGSAATLYTCPTGKVARILHIHVSNPSAGKVDLNLSIGADTAATRVYDDFPLAADSVEHNYDPYELAAGETIQGWASSAATVVLTITGYERPA